MHGMILFLVISTFALGLGGPPAALSAERLPDEPEPGRHPSRPGRALGAYDRALSTWKTAEDVRDWIAHRFTYDRARAAALSSNRRAGRAAPPILRPSDLFRLKAGVCVDLARFGVETLRAIDPESDPKYLMIEFVPLRVGGNTFRLHWLVSFTRQGKKFFFCDSKRPGFIAGPYRDTPAFLAEYGRFRGRKIVAHRELDSYRRRRKARKASTARSKR